MRRRASVPDIIRRMYRREPVLFPRLAINRQQLHRYGDRGSAEVSPWRIVWIDPQIVIHTPKGKSQIYPKDDRLVSHLHDGDWDRNLVRFDQNPIVQAIRTRILHETPWVETELLRELRQRFSSPRPSPAWHGCRTMEDVHARCAVIDRLILAISTSGYRTPPGIAYGRSGLTEERWPQAVSVGVDRNGGLLHLNGRHRMAIAQSIGLTQIPVRIGVRHTGWQRLRQEHVMSDTLQVTAPALATHPDIAYLLPDAPST